ncbi:hypothetical protein ACSBOB_25165 [Mesorhizobium sp. ASY16-5R]|uniref:hypothetical protein n=1 Tax=Mesorhizobium sp. ASY16-5R TaxID=3445772 RepID=UPI003F9F3473
MWIGFWATVGSVAFLVLDYRVGKQSGRPLLSKGSTTRLYYYALVGGASGALLAAIPVMVFDFGKAIVGLVIDPPPPRLLLGLPPIAAGVAAGFVLVTAAKKRWQTGIRDLRSDSAAQGIGNLTLAVCLFALTMLAIWLGTFMGFHIVRDG